MKIISILFIALMLLLVSCDSVQYDLLTMPNKTLIVEKIIEKNGYYKFYLGDGTRAFWQTRYMVVDGIKKFSVNDEVKIIAIKVHN